ncbi:MAG: hypothetical protein HY377_01645 [Candidatus Blackburnbacteria bacterium]|nr:hypothetical protein [Candidatus Blackburnbacteria bacterium]
MTKTQKAADFPVEIIRFVEELLTRSGMDIVNSEVRETMKKDLLSRLEAKLMLEAIKSLNGDGKERLMLLLRKNPSPEELLEFLVSENADYENVLEKSLSEFRKSYLLI